MSIARAELRGTGAATLLHVVAIAALSMSLAHVAKVPEAPPMSVELVDEVALEAAAPQSVAEPPPAAEAPEIPPPEPEPVAAPTPTPATPKLVAKPSPSPRPVAKPAPPRSAPSKPQPRQTGSRLGDDFLKGLPNSPSQSRAEAQPAAPKFDARAKASIGDALLRQARPCASAQTYLGEGADRLKLKVNLRFNRNGRLAAPPRVLGIAGDSDLRSRYGELLEDQVRRIFTQCAPFRLPAELYDTPSGGWNDYTFVYRVEK